MGCGQSQIGIIYPRKSKNKDGSKKNGNAVEAKEAERDSRSDSDSTEGGIESEETRLRSAARVRQIVQMSSGPLLAHTEMSSSQHDFFKMLDEKVESGPDYDSTCEYEIALEHARLCRLLHDWEVAKMRSRSKSAPSTPAKKHYRYNSLQVNGDLQRHHKNLYSTHYQMSHSVVMFDNTRGNYYTELA